MTKSISQHRKGVLLVLVSALMFGSYGVWSKLISDAFGSFYQGWTRGLILTVVLFPILLYRKEFVRIHRQDYKWLAVFLVFTSMTQAPIFYAFNHMDIGTASLLFFVTMLLTMYTFGILFLGEKLTRLKVVCFILAGIGLYTIFSFSLVVFTLFAASMAVVNGIASGGEVASSKKLTGNYSPLFVTWLSWGIVFVSNLIISMLIGETQHLPSIDVVWLYQLGYTFSSLFAFWFVIAGLKQLEASIGGLLGLLEIIFSILFGMLIFGESISARIVVGAICIIAAASLPHVHELLEKKSAITDGGN